MGDDVLPEEQGYSLPYTQHQLNQYVKHIGLPLQYRPSSDPALDISLLTALHIHQISTIPYENLDLHYSGHHSVSLDPQEIFDKFITRKRNRGGYCMEASLFFLWMLQCYGFDVYPTGVRIRLRSNGVPQGDFKGLVHIVLIITFASGEKYVSDVAFGGDGMTYPLPLVEGNVTTNLGTQENRYVYDVLEQNPLRRFSKPQKYWIYQYRNKPSDAWNAFYCFTEDEYLIGDYDVINWYTSQGKTFQRVLMLIIKFIRDESKLGEASIKGKVMLVNNVVKRNMGGRTEVVQECRSEEERIEALKRWFGITLVDEERDGIRGLVTEIHAPEEKVISV